MKTFDLYGFKGITIDEAKSIIERLLTVQFVARESSYLGEYYQHESSLGEEFKIQLNYDSVEDEWREEDFTDYDILLYVSKTERADALRECLVSSVPAAVLLRHEEL